MSTFDTDPFEPQPEGQHTIFPFWVPSPTANHAPNSGSGYVELPYTLAQDSTLFLLLREKTPEIWFQKLDWIAGHGGMVLLDTHPDYMSFTATHRTSKEYPVRLYRELLTYIQSRYPNNYWPALPRQVATFVGKERGQQAIAAEPAIRAVSPSKLHRLRGRRGAVVLFSHYPADPRPRRAAEALAAEGVSIDMICLRDDLENKERADSGNINVFRVPLQRRRGGKLSYIGQYAAFLLTSFVYLSFRSLTRRYDFVHVHNMPDVLVFSAAIPKLLGAKIILDLHDPMPELMRTIFELPEHSFGVRMLKRLEKWSVTFADVILTVNLACKKIYSLRGCPPEKIKVILNSPDDTVFQFRRPPSLRIDEDRPVEARNGRNGAQNRDDATNPKPFVILYHGSLVHRNGFDLAVDALEQVRRTIPDAKLAVCGQRTAYFDEVMESARRRGLEGNLEYLGVKNVRGIVEAISNCDLGVIPNHRNIFTEINTPTRIFEYLALGKPVIAPRAKGIQDYFSDLDLIFFELGDADDLARQIQFAASHPREVEKTVERGQQIYLAHTWSREKLNLLNTVSEML